MVEKLIKIKGILNKIRKYNSEQVFIEKNGDEIVVHPQVFSPIYFADSLFFANNMTSPKGLDVLEIGTGTGLFAIKMALYGAKSVIATDISKVACINARQNISKFHLEDKIFVREGSLFEPIKNEKFDIIFWNIPFCYVDEKVVEQIGINKPMDELDRSVFNYEYKLLEYFLKQGFAYLKQGGNLLLGFSPTIGSKIKFNEVLLKLGVSCSFLKSEEIEMDGSIETLQILQFDPPKIELNNISVQFGSLKVLSDINLSIQKGKITTILGPSGSGKTTLLRCIAGLNKKYSGAININRSLQMEYLNKERIAVVNQEYSVFPWLTVRQNIGVGVKGKAKNKNVSVDEIINSVGLKGFEDYYPNHPNQLSGGMQQRVAIGRAIIQDTDILVFDEPFGALDYQTRLKLQQLIKQIRDKYAKTIIFVTHDIEEAIFISNRILILSKAPSIIAEDIQINLNSEIKQSTNNQIRYTSEFIACRSKIETIIDSLSQHSAIKQVFVNINQRFLELRNVDYWNTFLINECRKEYTVLNTKDQLDLSLRLLDSTNEKDVIIGSLLHASTESEVVKEKLRYILGNEHSITEKSYFLIHSLTNMKISDAEKGQVKNLIYSSVEEFCLFERKYFTLNGVLQSNVVLRILSSRFNGMDNIVNLNNKGWLLLISSLAHSNTKEIIDFLTTYIDDDDLIMKETAQELLQKINNNEIDFEKIRR